ncbi:hypothetical protein EHQ46_06050 [Leptospira yanagawae]|uniref:Uncharacterized protein n=1 Tax=Leptospira yanagawae TaxID=293069 RepID=A0ABY2M3D0_9LEPT|nr:hypothetical protein EHQ46_06050 [Leptospira yanagawae]
MKKICEKGNFFSFFEIHSAWVKMGNFIPKIGRDRVYFNKILSFQNVKKLIHRIIDIWRSFYQCMIDSVRIRKRNEWIGVWFICSHLGSLEIWIPITGKSI